MSPRRSKAQVVFLDEETPLLRDVNPQRKETPLPLAQILVLLLLQLSEPITSSSIRPYINQVRSSIPITQVVGNATLACP
jgi:hypothetical protein